MTADNATANEGQRMKRADLERLITGPIPACYEPTRAAFDALVEEVRRVRAVPSVAKLEALDAEWDATDPYARSDAALAYLDGRRGCARELRRVIADARALGHGPKEVNDGR